MSDERERKIRKYLERAFSPVELMVKDQSHLHAGHAGARDGKGHFELIIVSERFAGQSAIQRHRMVYDALAPLMETDIHALRLRTLTPAERHTQPLSIS
ncbi:MAG: BolA family protein [Woeseiaceae bacterium]